MTNNNKILLVTDKKQPSGLHFTTQHTGKMKGMYSLSTACSVNPQCQRNSKIEGSICSKCFAIKQMKRYPNMRDPFEKNFKILTESILDDSVLPYTNCLFFRLESFGDLGSPIQAANYFNLARKNPQTKFALWTKNPKFIAQAIEMGYSKPDNIQIIYSSLFINKRNVPKMDFIDKVFTVFEKGKEDSPINCGAKCCYTCHRCYDRNPKGVKVGIINETLK